MDEKKQSNLKVLKNKRVLGILAAVILIVLFALYIRLFVYNDKAEVTSEQINLMLSKESELTTAKLNGKGYSQYTDKGLPIVNKSDFFMTYEYTVRAGVDLKKVESRISKSEKTVWLTVPKAEIFDVKVEPSSIKYYDTGFALFNVDEKEDANLAQAEAEKAARKDAEETGILDMADEQAKTLIKGIIAEAIPNEYQIKFKEN